jgi:hypothetical protein
MKSQEISKEDDDFSPDVQKVKKINTNKTMSLRNKNKKR